MLNTELYTPTQTLTKYPYFKGKNLRRLNKMLAKAIIEQVPEGCNFIRIPWDETLNVRQIQELKVLTLEKGWLRVIVNNYKKELIFYFL